MLHAAAGTHHLADARRAGAAVLDTTALRPQRLQRKCLDACSYADVCLSSRDGLLVPDTTQLEPAWRSEFGASGWLHNRSKPSGLRLLPLQPWRSRRARDQNQARTGREAGLLYLKGDVLTVNCWRQALHRTNPSHLLVSYSLLLQAAVDGEVGRRTRGAPLAAIVFHQCPGGAHGAPTPWPFASAVWRVIETRLREAKLTDASTQLLTLTAEHTFGGSAYGSPRRLPGVDEPLVCAQRLHAIEPTYRFLAKMDDRVLTAWREGYTREYNRRLPAGSPDAIREMPRSLPADIQLPSPRVMRRVEAAKGRNGSTCGTACARSLRVALWQRSAGSANGRRHIHGEATIAALVSEVTDEPLLQRVPSENMSWVEQVQLARAADVILTAHSSALVNLVFADTATAVIEMSAIHVDGTFCGSAGPLVRGYFMSYGHLPLGPAPQQHAMSGGGAALRPDFTLVKAMDRCHFERKRDNGKFTCPTADLKNSDLLVNEQRLRADLHAAASLLCSCDQKEREQLQRLAQQACFPNEPLHSWRAKPQRRGRSRRLGGGRGTAAKPKPATTRRAKTAGKSGGKTAGKSGGKSDGKSGGKSGGKDPRKTAVAKWSH